MSGFRPSIFVTFRYFLRSDPILEDRKVSFHKIFKYSIFCNGNDLGLRAEDGRVIPRLNETPYMHFGFSLLLMMFSFMFC
jgi:hypothetical protein